MNRIVKTLSALAGALLAPSISVPAGASGPINVAGQAGIAEVTRTYSITENDYNKDGRKDLWLVRHGPERCCPQPKLYKNQGNGTFSPYQKTWPNKDRHVCDFGDANNDGLTDFFCAVGLGQYSTNELEIQQAGGGWAEKAGEKGLANPSTTHGRYRQATFLDANNDGRLDVFVSRFTGPNLSGTCQPDCYPGDDFPNELWLQRTDGTFGFNTSYGISTPLGAHKDADACALPTDFTGDGRDDLTYCAPEGIKLWRNDGDHFTNVANTLGVGGKAIDAAWSDVNRDGKLDLVEINRGSVKVFLRGAAGGMNLAYSFALSEGLSVAVGDMNGDGTKDIWAVGSCYGARTADHPDFLLLGTGGGQFTPLHQPAVTQGCGDDVASIDYDQNGKIDFAVTNGRKKVAGPVQLFTWQQ
jgi:FG-GAP-like repeat